MTVRTYKDFIPPWQDMATLCAHICATPNTVNSWVEQKILPPPRKHGGKLMWKWSEVDARLTVGAPQGNPSTPANEIDDEIARDVKRAIEGHANH